MTGRDTGVASWLPPAKQAVERFLAEHDYDTSAAIPVMMLVLREGDPIALLTAPGPSQLAEFGAAAVSGFEADELVVLADIFATKSRVNPEGRPWGVGEMSRRAHEPAVRALLVDQVVAYQLRRRGRPTAAAVTYRVEGRRVAWDEPGPVAFLMDSRLTPLHHAIQAPWLSELPDVPQAPAGMDDGERRLHQSLGAVRAIVGHAQERRFKIGVGIFTSNDPEVVRLVNESLRRAGLAGSAYVLGGADHAN